MAVKFTVFELGVDGPKHCLMPSWGRGQSITDWCDLKQTRKCKQYKLNVNIKYHTGITKQKCSEHTSFGTICHVESLPVAGYASFVARSSTLIMIVRTLPAGVVRTASVFITAGLVPTLAATDRSPVSARMIFSRFNCHTRTLSPRARQQWRLSNSSWDQPLAITIRRRPTPTLQRDDLDGRINRPSSLPPYFSISPCIIYHETAMSQAGYLAGVLAPVLRRCYAAAAAAAAASAAAFMIISIARHWPAWCHCRVEMRNSSGEKSARFLSVWIRFGRRAYTQDFRYITFLMTKASVIDET